jgi:GNAT superfamily N-acetyltransferase
MLLEGELTGRPKPFDILPIVDDAGWRAFSELHMENWLESRTVQARDQERATGERMTRGKREKSPPLRWWLGYIDGMAAGYFSSWEGIDGVGQVEYLFVKPAFRNRGLATALIHHCVADARAHGAGSVVIVTGAADTPKQMYGAMGFRPAAVKYQYLTGR